MWTSTLDLDPKRVLLTQLLGRFWRGAYFSSFAPLRVENVPRQPLPSNNWVRVRNRLAGICGSDLHLIYIDGDVRIAPAAIPSHGYTYLGHEVVGEVNEIGTHVQQLQVGERVALQSGPNCFSAGVQPLCRSCASGNYNLCERGTLPGPQPIGGGWSEEMLLHEQQLFRIPTAISDEQAVLLEPTAVALHAVLRHLPQSGDRVLIIGAGTIGLLMLQILHVLAPQVEISVLARHSFQVEQATRMGAAHIIYPQDSYVGIQRATQAQMYDGLLGNRMLLGGYDVIYDTVGSRKTLHHALRWARANATLVLVGLNLHMMYIDLSPIWYQEVNLIGTFGHGTENWPIGTRGRRSTFSIAADLIERGLLHPEQLVTHHFALDKYRDALMTAAAKAQSRAIKVVFDYSLLPISVVPNIRASHQHRPAALDAKKLAPVNTPTQGPASRPLDPSLLPVTPPAPVPLSPNPSPSPSPIYATENVDPSITTETAEDTATSLPAVVPLAQETHEDVQAERIIETEQATLAPDTANEEQSSADTESPVSETYTVAEDAPALSHPIAQEESSATESVPAAFLEVEDVTVAEAQPPVPSRKKSHRATYQDNDE